MLYINASCVYTAYIEINKYTCTFFYIFQSLTLPGGHQTINIPILTIFARVDTELLLRRQAWANKRGCSNARRQAWQREATSLCLFLNVRHLKLIFWGEKGINVGIYYSGPCWYPIYPIPKLFGVFVLRKTLAQKKDSSWKLNKNRQRDKKDLFCKI